MIYEPRNYRKSHSDKTESYTLCIADTDLLIISDWRDDQLVLRWMRQLRNEVIREIEIHKNFMDSFVPVVSSTNHPMVVRMADAARKAGVGPMAAVAGAIAEGVGLRLLEKGQTAIVENGGDLFLAHTEDMTVRLEAGASSLSGRIGIRIRKDQMPAGLCTSSGTTGHSVSFGKADAVAILSSNGALADAVATATANHVQRESDIESALHFALGIEGVTGAVIVVNDTFGALGDVELIHI